MTEMYGLSGGGAQINKAKEEFANLLEKLIQLASLQTAFKTLDEALKVTSRRVNALDNVVVPRLENTVQYVKQELDELEREDFTRLKKVVEKKGGMEDEESSENGAISTNRIVMKQAILAQACWIIMVETMMRTKTFYFKISCNMLCFKFTMYFVSIFKTQVYMITRESINFNIRYFNKGFHKNQKKHRS